MTIKFALWALPFEIACLVLATQPSAVSPVPAPLRDLPWAQLNFLHTTDTHGWHAGHLQEPSYSADWGDYISFSDHLRQKADDEGKDLLLVDTGDRIEGNGLYDASRPKGKYDLEIFSERSYDAICSGNHELYKRASIEYEYNTTVPRYKDTYIASNLDVLDDSEKKPLAQRFKKFTTKNQGIRILTFGFLFNFANGANNIVVQKVEDTIKEKWFQDAIRDRDVDLVLVIAHADLHSPELEAIYKAIRGQQWDVPIQFFGGHSHIRDYKKFDKKAYALQSGRYLETIGFMSIDGLNTGGSNKHYSRLSSLLPRSNPPPARIENAASPTFSRRYIDNNLYSFHHHTALNSTTFSTPHGLNVSTAIKHARSKLHLDRRFGCAPADFWTNRAPYPSPRSIFTLIANQIFPAKVTQEDRKHVPRMVLTNTGAMRFDIFEGPFTRDSMYAVSPFTSGFRYIKDVPFKFAKQLLKILNQEVPQLWPVELSGELGARVPVKGSVSLSEGEQRVDEQNAQEVTHSRLPSTPLQDSQIPLRAPVEKSSLNDKSRDDDDLTPGYTTHDDAGTDGDDALHAPIKFYSVPNCIESRVAFPEEAKDPDNVDLIYNSFLEQYVLLALKFLGSGFDEGSTEVYMGGKTMTDVIGDWVQENWKCEDDDDDDREL